MKKVPIKALAEAKIALCYLCNKPATLIMADLNEEDETINRLHFCCTSCAKGTMETPDHPEIETIIITL